MAHHTWKPIAGGVLSIVAGSVGVCAGLVLLMIGGTLSGILAAIGIPGYLSFLTLPVFGSAAAPTLIMGVIAIIGGAYAVRRRLWPLALAGAICAVFPSQMTVVGVLAIIFVVMGKDEFK